MRASASARRSAGLRPIVEFMTWNFAMQAIDQIINSAAKTLYMSGGQMGCPIVFRGPNGAAVARRRAAQPELRRLVRASAGPEGRRALLRRRREGPAQGRDPRSESGDLSRKRNRLRRAVSMCRRSDDFVLPIGKARVVREGSDVTLVSYSITMGLILQAADALAKEGISAEVIDLRSLRPLDTATVVASVKKTNRIVIVEEGWPICGIASEVCDAGDGAGVRLSRRAARARDRQGRADALRRQSRKAGAAQRSTK